MGRKKKKQSRPWCWYPFCFLEDYDSNDDDDLQWSLLRNRNFWGTMLVVRSHSEELSLLAGDLMGDSGCQSSPPLQEETRGIDTVWVPRKAGKSIRDFLASPRHATSLAYLCMRERSCFHCPRVYATHYTMM